MIRSIADEDEGAGEPLYELIELMFFAYRDFVEDADRVLADDGFGRAHHRVLYFVAQRPGLSVAELLDILRITKQSLNRVLKDLLERGYVASELGQADRRQRHLHATTRGEALVRGIARRQSARFERAFAALGEEASDAARDFLAAMTDAGLRKDAPLRSDGAARRTEAPKLQAEASRTLDGPALERRKGTAR